MTVEEKIIRCLKRRKTGLKPKEIAEKAKCNANSVRRTICAMFSRKVVRCDKAGLYWLAA